MRTVVIVDDSEDMRYLARSFIEFDERPTAVVGEAADGVEAVDVVRLQLPDVAIVDFRMPGPDGLETAEALLAVSSGLRVILLSAHLTPATRSLAKAIGVFACVDKSDMRRLSDLIHEPDAAPADLAC